MEEALIAIMLVSISASLTLIVYRMYDEVHERLNIHKQQLQDSIERNLKEKEECIPCIEEDQGSL